MARVWRDAWFYCAVLVYTVAGLMFLAAAGNIGGTSYSNYIMPGIKWLLIFAPAVALSYDGIAVIVRFDQRRSLAFRRVFSRKRLASLLAGLLMMAGIIVFYGTFTSVKTTLPIMFDGFLYDRFQADLDAMLHFGIDPWRFLHVMEGQETITAIINFNYGPIWFSLCFGVLFFVATSPRADGYRMRYLMMFMFVWVVIGNLLAGAFLSAGPVYYGQVTGDTDRFAGLLAFLALDQSTRSVQEYQQYLWMLYEARMPGIASGISAFPSVHVALATMNAMFVFERSRSWGILATVYVGVVQASSVFLGWHYAIDGYASIVLVVSAHFVLRRLMPKSSGSVPVRSANRRGSIGTSADVAAPISP
ncbi:phosphatase PAP2 family protein [Hoeflea sp. AS60]|uniref:phosphatase PAP2 family protein n=1 Tax=Hoeflea sp. AS60 TaxID=3135780 RepID=UPI00319D8938